MVSADDGGGALRFDGNKDEDDSRCTRVSELPVVVVVVACRGVVVDDVP